MSIRRTANRAFAFAALAVSIACAPQDPRDDVLEQRARWEITSRGFLERDDGRILLTVGVAGPARSRLEQLTFRVELRDPSGRVLDRLWRTLDLTAIPLGVGTDVSVDLGFPPEGFVTPQEPREFGEIVVDRVLDPSPEESQRIVELQL